MEIRFYHLITFDWILAVEIVKKSHTVPEISLPIPQNAPWYPSVRGVPWGILGDSQCHAQATPSIEASVTKFCIEKSVTLASIEGVA